MPHSAIQTFGSAPDGSPVQLIRIKNGGASAAVMTWGASLQDFRIAGIAHALVLGSPSFDAYLDRLRNYGPIVGRVANRIAGGRATLDGQQLLLERNERDVNCLHGGGRGAGSGVSSWRLDDCDATSCRLSICLADGLAGFPGNLDLSARYSLDDSGALTLEIEGQTDAPTFCNMAHHAYWTLAADAGLSGHRLSIAADDYLPVDDDKIPLGAPVPVAGTRFDFRQPREVIQSGDAPLDHNFCLRVASGLRRVCRLETDTLQLDIASDAPGLQVYDGGKIDSSDWPTHSGKPYGAHAGLAIEPQAWPDAPNQPDYPQITLRPGERYRQVSRFHVSRKAVPDKS